MSRRLFDVNTWSGAVEYFHYDESSDTFTIEMVQDLEPLAEVNKAQFNEFTSARDPWGEFGDRGTHVARIPPVIWQQWYIDGSWRDQAFLKRFLNDPDNRVFRTRPGQV